MASQPSGPLFSIIIPTFNRADRILPTLESVRTQHFADFECIVIDDGSNDGDQLAAVVSSLEDDRFRYVRQENGGACRARNLGFDLASGMYVALLDSDDLFVPEKLARHAAFIGESEGEMLIYSRMVVERGLDRKWLRPSRGLKAGERVDEYLLCTSGTMRTSTVVVSTSLARRVRFDESLPSLQDTDFAIRVANAGATIAFLEEPLVIFEDRVGFSRVSRNSNFKPLLLWLELMRGSEITERAYWAGRGWQCARIASYTDRPYAVWLYLQSLVRGVFSPRQALIVAAQVGIPYRAYQWVANRVVTIFGLRSV